MCSDLSISRCASEACASGKVSAFCSSPTMTDGRSTTNLRATRISMNLETNSPQKRTRIRRFAAMILIAQAVVLQGCARISNAALLIRGQDNVCFLQINQVVANWGFKAHALAFSRTLLVHSLRLPAHPSGITTFDANQIELMVMSERDGSKATVQPLWGYLTVDLNSKRVVVAISTESGPFSGNGTYPLEGYGPPLGC